MEAGGHPDRKLGVAPAASLRCIGPAGKALAFGLFLLAACGGEGESRSAIPKTEPSGACDLAPYTRQLTVGIAVLAPIDPFPGVMGAPLRVEDLAPRSAGPETAPVRDWLALAGRFADAASDQQAKAVGAVAAEAPAAFAALRRFAPAASASRDEADRLRDFAANAWRTYADIVYADFLVSGDSDRFLRRMEELLAALGVPPGPVGPEAVAALGRDALADRGFVAALTSFALLRGALGAADRAYQAMIADSLAPPEGARDPRLAALDRYADPAFHRYVTAADAEPCDLRVFLVLQDLAFWSMRSRASGEPRDERAAGQLEQLLARELAAKPELAQFSVLAEYWRQHRRSAAGADRADLDRSFWPRARGLDAPLLLSGVCARSPDHSPAAKGTCR